MIGGNGYGEKPDGELIVRWAQANTFMPSMQFSYLPWEYNATGVSFKIYYVFNCFIMAYFKDDKIYGYHHHLDIYIELQDDIEFPVTKFNRKYLGKFPKM